MTPEPAPVGAFVSGHLTLRNAALFTDLYELTMAASYWREGMAGEATFSLFSRRLPRGRSFLVAAGLEDVLDYLRAFRFSPEGLEYLATLGVFDPGFLEFLSTVRFTGDVHAVAEGTPVFTDEPLLEVTAPIIEAQLVETAVLNLTHAQTVVTSKAARCVLAARGRAVVEFGLRRTPGVDAGMKAARCAYIAGATSSSNVLAGLEYGIPPTGTMAHSYISAFPHEIDAFRAFARAFPDRTILLLDTYDTVAGAHKAVTVAREMAAAGHRLAGVRLDSGDLVALSREVRAVLDAAGFTDARIFASGGLDEDEIVRCLDARAPIDAFGVGTRMDVSADAPYLDMAYKLVRYDGRDVLKTSAGKTTWAGPKQVYRVFSEEGRATADVLALRDEPPPGRRAEAILLQVMRAGEPIRPHPPLADIRARYVAAIGALGDEVTRLRDPAPYTVRPSERLVANQRTLEARIRATEAGP